MLRLLLVALILPLMAKGGPRKPIFSGHTGSTYNGNLGGIKGANQKCNTAYSGSHACTFREIKALGYNTNLYSTNFWVIDGHKQTLEGPGIHTKDGADWESDGTSYYRQNCLGWSTTAAGSGTPGSPYNRGAYMLSTGTMVSSTCNNTLVLPCCK